MQNVVLWNGPAGIDGMFQDRYFTKIARKLATNNIKTQDATHGDEVATELRLRLYTNFGMLFLYVVFLLSASLAIFWIEFRCNFVLNKLSKICQERYRLILEGLKRAVNVVRGIFSQIRKRICELFIVIFQNVVALFNTAHFYQEVTSSTPARTLPFFLRPRVLHNICSLSPDHHSPSRLIVILSFP